MASKRHTITVTQEIIDTAIRGSSRRCMVADAIAAAIPDASQIRVDSVELRFTLNGHRYSWITPNIAQWAIIDFDAGLPVEPFVFKLNHDNARRLRRHAPTTAAGRAKVAQAAAERAAAKREGRDPDPELVSVRGVEWGTVSGGVKSSRPPAMAKARKDAGLPAHVRMTHRSYGIRELRVNRHREDDGLLPARDEEGAPEAT